MPKPQRTPEEIDQAKAGILDKAANLIVEVGYTDFTMRKLAAKLGITATTIYNYYKNKDELFIHLLIRGFEELYEQLDKARRNQASPAKQLRAMIEAYTDFGLTNPDFYNLMYSWHVPKYNTYAGTDLEPVARIQLETAMKIPDIFLGTILSLAESMKKTLGHDDAVFFMIHYWSQIHGFIAGINNTNLGYIHKDPLSLKGKHLDWIEEKFKRDLFELKNQGESS